MRRSLMVLLATAGCFADPSSVPDTDGGSTSTSMSTSMGVGTRGTTSSNGATEVDTTSGLDTGSSTGPAETTDDPPDTETSTGGEPPLDPATPWDEAVAVTALNSGEDDDDPWLSPDLLEIYFASRRGGADEEIFMSTRDDPAAEDWAPPIAVAGVNSAVDEGNPVLSPDGLSLFFTRTENSNSDIWVATRDSPLDLFGMPAEVSELNTTTANELRPAPTNDFLSILFVRAEAGGGELLSATRPRGTSMWGMVSPIEALNSSGNDTTPWTDGDATYVVFSSDRMPSAGMDLWFSTRPGAGGEWAPPEPVDSLNTGDAEADPWVSSDLHTIYFSRESPAGLDILVAHR